MFIVGGYGDKGYSYDHQFELDQLMRKIATDIAFTIRQLDPAKVVFTLDSGSWRKKIEIEENEGYKANRDKKSSHINWDNIYATMDEFSKIMEDQGFIVSKVNSAEADDLMALWMDKITFQNNEHLITISGDEDIRQLVKFWPYEPGKKVFSLVYNPFTYKRGLPKKLYAPEAFNQWLKEDEGINDIFNTATDVDKDTFVKILTKDVEVEVVDGEDIGLRKIFCGDDGDNIPAIYTWMSKTAKGDPIERRITKAKYAKIKETYNLKDHHDLFDHTEAIFADIAKIAKHDPPFDMAKRFHRQIKLVILSKHVFPEQIVSDFEETADEMLKHDQPKVIGASVMTLLEGTRYVSDEARNHASESDIFKQMDDIAKSLF